jgi:protein-disulfide isomerase
MGTYVNPRYRSRIRPDPTPAEEERLRRSPVLWTIVGTLAAVIGVGVLGWWLMQEPPPPSLATPVAVSNDGGLQAGLTVAGTGPTVVEVYQDFTSSDSLALDAQLRSTLDALVAQNRIRLVWHPLGTAEDSAGDTGDATRSANAAACAADAGKARAFADALYANQPAPGRPGLSDDQIMQIAGPVGLNAPSFAACVRDQRYRDWVGVVDARAAERAVSGAPAIYVNGTALQRPTAAALTAAVG